MRKWKDVDVHYRNGELSFNSLFEMPRVGLGRLYVGKPFNSLFEMRYIPLPRNPGGLHGDFQFSI